MPRSKSAAGFLVILVGLILSGCHTGTLPDPNDPNDVGSLQPEVLRKNLHYASDALMERRVNGEISDADYQALMAKAANELLTQVQIEKVDPTKAWEYAEVFRTAKRWREAAKFLEVAVKDAANEDRFVNDSLRLAQCLCNLNQVPQAVSVARATFKAKPTGKAPILPAVLLEIVPAGRGKGDDIELAKLLEEAIHQSELTVVNQNSQPGKDFIFARPYHIRKAWNTILTLYEEGGRKDLAATAGQRAKLDLAKYDKT